MVSGSASKCMGPYGVEARVESTQTYAGYGVYQENKIMVGIWYEIFCFLVVLKKN